MVVSRNAGVCNGLSNQTMTAAARPQIGSAPLRAPRQWVDRQLELLVDRQKGLPGRQARSARYSRLDSA
jgi:hypothetical protein